MQKPIELVEVVLSRPGQGTYARGPVMAASGTRAVGVLLGPVEAKPGDLVGIIATGRQPQVWELEEGFFLAGRKIKGGTFANGAKLNIQLDVAEIWSVDRSAKMYSSRYSEYVHAFNDPDVVVVL